jgi:hypothetical protein
MEFCKTHQKIEKPKNRLIRQLTLEKQRDLKGPICPEIFQFSRCFHRLDAPVNLRNNFIKIQSLKKFRIEINEVLNGQRYERKYEQHLPEVHLKIEIVSICGRIERDLCG